MAIMRRAARKAVGRIAQQLVEHVRRVKELARQLGAVDGKLGKLDELGGKLDNLSDKIGEIDNKASQTVSQLQQFNQHDFRLDRLKAMAERVEPYQPTYAVEGIFKNPRRSSQDRCIAIEQYLKSPGTTRLLDIGSSIGYVCFYFADRGAIAEGWEYNPENAEVSRLVSEVNGIQIQVKTKVFDDTTVKTIQPDSYDVVTILSVLHHIIHYNGLEYTQKLMAELLERAPLVIVELARKGEDKKLFWDRSQPDNELTVFDLVKDKVTIEKIGDFGNHLSSKTRPLYAVRAKQVIKVNGQLYAYDIKQNEAYEDSPVAYSQSIRRYYFSQKHIIKEYDFKNETDPENLRRIVAEINNLLHIKDVYKMPKLADFEISQSGAKVVLERAPGELLSEHLALHTSVNVLAVAKDLLHSLADLEKQGLHHNDLRSWNVLYDGKHASLIDYGFVSHVVLDDDISSLLWVVHSVLTGDREGYEQIKKLPPRDVFAAKPQLLKLYDAVKKGERSPSAILKILS